MCSECLPEAQFPPINWRQTQVSKGLLTVVVKSRDQYCAGIVNAQSTCRENGANIPFKSGRLVTELIPAPPQLFEKSNSRSGFAMIAIPPRPQCSEWRLSSRSLTALFRLAQRIRRVPPSSDRAPHILRRISMHRESSAHIAAPSVSIPVRSHRRRIPAPHTALTRTNTLQLAARS